MGPKKSIVWRTDFYSFAIDSENNDDEGETDFKYRETEYGDNNKISNQIEYNKNGTATLEVYNKY